MRLVVNTNRIMAALIKDSISRKILMHMDAEFVTIHFSKKEIQQHKIEVLHKASISEKECEILLDTLFQKMVILDDKLIDSKMKEAALIMDKIDPDDTPFIAAALAANADIWSDDKHFDAQSRVKVWKTKDLVFGISSSN